jgi:crotonobetainyl-CoA:carnitine CoA-transferase CaiB-like acyl-CoA transferase
MLDAVRVLEVGGRAAAICGRLFAQLGADVITLHAPGRPVADRVADEELVFDANKRAATIDLTDDAGRDAFHARAADADLLILELPPAKIEALHLQRLRAFSPELVVVTITPFGYIGPKRDYRGGDLATRRAREQHFNALYELMAAWSADLTAEEITARCQARHVPCFPFGEPHNLLHDPQLRARGFFVPLERPGAASVMIPRPPFGLPVADYAVPKPARAGATTWEPRERRPAPTAAARAGLPLDGVRVLDFSWVIAGPTSTRYMSLMGAEVIKVESPARPDTGRGSELHDVLGESKLSIEIDLKADGALDVVRRLLQDTDIVVENFAPGVMDRLGLGYDDLRKFRGDIIMVSCSGLGSTGPRASWVAYGSLVSAYAGFLDEGPGREPRTGLAWADPLSGLLLAFSAVAALHERDRHGGGRHVDFSMLEALLWTMPEALVGAQFPGISRHRVTNEDPDHVPHNVYRTLGDDRWIAIGVTDDAEWAALCREVPAFGELGGWSVEDRREHRPFIDAELRAWARDRDPVEAMDLLQAAGIPASVSYTANDLFGDSHLWARGFFDLMDPRRGGAAHYLPGLPWRWGDRSLIRPRPAPREGQDTERILLELANVSNQEYESLRSSGALGRSTPA